MLFLLCFHVLCFIINILFFLFIDFPHFILHFIFLIYFYFRFFYLVPLTKLYSRHQQHNYRGP